MTEHDADPIRAAGLRRTPARVAVWQAIVALDRPVSHADLQAVPEIDPLDDITLYRTLAAFEEAGFVHRVHGIDGVWRYRANDRDAAGCPGNHPHFSCTACGAMSCLAEQRMPHVAVPPGATVSGRHFLVYGRCPRCAGDAESP